MNQNVEELSAFYRTAMGIAARRAILSRLTALWPHCAGQRLLGYGFALPYLPAFRAERSIAASPAAMGVTPWPREAPTTTLCDEDALPFADSMFDRVLVVHGLERADTLRPLLRQIWRVLAPEGRLLIVAPNRASLWAQVEVSPFGRGRPFSRGELDQTLRDAMLAPEHWTHALYAPPISALRGPAWERIGPKLFPALAGVHVVEATKSLYAPASTGPALAAQPAALKAADF